MIPRNLLFILGFAIAAVFLFSSCTTLEPQRVSEIPDDQPRSQAIVRNEQGTVLSSVGRFDAQDFVDNIRSGGPPKDGIPPIDLPKYWTAAEADEFLSDEDVVFGAVINGEAKAYPRKIMVWHEIVNEQFGDEQLSITYCPLTGSAIGFKGDFSGVSTNFGTSGKLVNSNLIMYDRDADTYWPQILGRGINGDHAGVSLERFQVYWTTWSKWKTAHPDTEVLSSDTGFLRSYGKDPYGEYSNPNSYYNIGAPIFPVMNKDIRLPAKEVVIGVDYNGKQLAVQKSLVAKEEQIITQVDDQQFIVVYNEALDSADVYLGEGLDNVNTVEGLEYVPSFDVMWFGWSSFFPETEVLLDE